MILLNLNNNPRTILIYVGKNSKQKTVVVKNFLSCCSCFYLMLAIRDNFKCSLSVNCRTLFVANTRFTVIAKLQYHSTASADFRVHHRSD